jgi:hypothetical protein
MGTTHHAFLSVCACSSPQVKQVRLPIAHRLLSTGSPQPQQLFGLLVSLVIVFYLSSI